MRFVLKALFFLAVVAAFLPRQPGAEAASQPAAVEPQVVETAAEEFCDRRPALCQTAEESAFAVRIVGGLAAAQARQMIADATAGGPPEDAEASASGDTPAP